MADEETITITRAEYELLSGSRVVRQGSYGHKLLTMLQAAENNFLKKQVLMDNASNLGNRKTRFTVLQRLADDGHIELGYRLTKSGEAAVRLSKPLLKHRQKLANNRRTGK